MRIKKFVALSLALGLMLAPIVNVTNTFAAKKTEISNVVNNFTWDYFNQMTTTNDNVFYSGYSMAEVMAMSANGGSSSLKKTVAKGLGISNLKSLNNSFVKFNKTLSSDYNTKGRTFKSSNLVMVDKTADAESPLVSSFRKTVKNKYNATVKVYDILNDREGAKSYIKNYVNKATSGFIPDYKSIINNTDKVDMLNAVYFKGDWAEPFSYDGTYDMQFITASGDLIDVPIMCNTSDLYGYYETKDYLGASLPYKLKGSNKVVSMYVITPNCGTCAKMFMRWQSETNTYKEKFINKIKTKSNREVCIYMPKFEISKYYNLEQYFKQFTYGEEYTNILQNRSLSIDRVVQQAKIKVDELGTEAAAVTEMTMKDNAAFGSDKTVKTVKLDKPFIFIIRDDSTGTNLFTGVVNNPAVK